MPRPGVLGAGKIPAKPPLRKVFTPKPPARPPPGRLLQTRPVQRKPSEEELAVEPDEDFGDEPEGEFQDAEDEEQPAEEDQPEEEDEENLREEDMSLEEVPEHLREAVQGNLELKRALSNTSDTNGSAAKRRKLSDADSGTTANPLINKLLMRWGLTRDSTARYALETWDREGLEHLEKTRWQPNRNADPVKKTPSLQISDALLRHKESQGPPGTALDVVSVLKYRFQFTSENEKLLRSLSHKDLRYVIREHDGTRPLEEVVEEATASFPEEGLAGVRPDGPGVKTVSRFGRLEVIDAFADALVFGDANLTFSVRLAEHRKALGHVGRIVATTFEQLETLRERYKEIDETVVKLEEHYAEVLHNVDCTRIAADTRFRDMEGKFGAVYYNFPHAGVVQGFLDGHPLTRWRHENLMHLLFRALRGFVKPGGSVKVASNAYATGVRFSDILDAAASNEFIHVETLPFLEWHLRHYQRSYGDRRDVNRRPESGDVYANQRAHTDMVYCFCYAPSGDTLPKVRVRLPPTKAELLDCKEGALRNVSGPMRQRKVEELHQLFLSYVQGVHVG